MSRLSSSTEIRDVMTPAPFTAELSSSLEEIRQLMETHGISHLPVVGNTQLLGIVTQRELQFGLGWSRSAGRVLRIEDIYVATCPYIAAPEALLMDVLEDMAARQLTCALVVDDGKLCGIFTTIDACREFSRSLRKLGGEADTCSESGRCKH